MKISSKLNTVVILFIFLHVVCWTLAPTFVRANLPMDSLEGAAWGQHLQFGYDRNPFLNGWLTALAVFISDYKAWSIYLFSQLSIGIGLWMIWLIAKKILLPFYAFIAILILEGVQYYNFHAIDFNDNNLEMSLWPLTIYFFYQATKPNYDREKPWAWIFTGIFAALAMMAKYYTAALLAAMTLFLLATPENRKHFTNKTTYYGLFIFLLLILPHIIWLFYHDFVTVTYVFDRADSIPTWRNHFTFAMQFAHDQFLAFLPAIILPLFLFLGSKVKSESQPHVNKFDRQFLWFVGMGPFILTLILSATLGIKLRGGWGMPLLALWSILLLCYIRPPVNFNKIKYFFSGIVLLMIVLVTGYAKSLLYSDTTSSANYPGREIAIKLTQDWHQQFHTSVKYVAGTRWIASNIHFYVKEHPSVFLEWNRVRSPWIDINDLRKKGAIFVWDIDSGETIPTEVKKNFPTLIEKKSLQFAWQNNHYNLKPVTIGVAFLPPENKF